MRLERIKIKNFRSYEGENDITFSSDLTAFIGKNDAGKSTIFDALDIFFNDTKPEVSDLCISAAEKEIVISCIFSNFPNEIIIDSTAETKLSEEFLLNGDGLYEVKKVFKCSEKTVSAALIHIRANHPKNKEIDNLHTLKITELKEKAEKLSIEVLDKRMSHLWRKALWNYYSDLKLSEVDLLVDDFDGKSKNIYKNLEGYYPLFFLFKSDRQTSDSDSEAKDPIQLAVKEAQKEYEDDIEKLRQKIQERVEEVSDRALEKLKEMDEGLASNLHPVLKSLPKWTFDYRIEDERGISLNKRGSGARRLVLLNFFRAEAERKSKSSEGNIIYAIEEPETSQHPDNQKMIIESLLSLAKDKKRQVFITTHSPDLLKLVPEEAIRFINSEESTVITFGRQALVLSAESLGVLSNQKFGGAKKVILVEGMPDCIFLEHAANCLKEAGFLDHNLNDRNILTLPLGGRHGIKTWIENNKAEDLGLTYAIFIDSDRKDTFINSPELTENESDCIAWGQDDVIAHPTRKQEIENYLDKSLVLCDLGDYDDAKKIISVANNVSERKIIETFWPQMSAQQILDNCKYVDEDDCDKQELLEFLKKLL